jgi:LysM repeat protein
VTEGPTPIPAEGVWSGDPADLPNWDAMPRRNRRRRRRGHYPIWLKYLGWVIGLAALVTAAQIAYHAIRSDPRDSTVFATRQLRSSALRPNETIVAKVDVWQRPPIDYFRATRGILVLTDAPGDTAKPIGGRLIYLGLQPRDPLSPPDAPPTFDERDWPVDTLVELEPTRTFFLISRALRITAPREGRLTLGLASGNSPSADTLRTVLERKYAALRAVGRQRREAQRAADRAAVFAYSEGVRPWYHTVRRGEALASIARMFNTTPDSVRAMNGIVGDRVRIGQTIMVKRFTPKPMRPPSGVVPERAPAAAASPPPTAAPPPPRKR